MKKILLIILPVTLILVGLFNAKTISATTQDVLYQSPCDTPKKYRLGNIDERFGLSDEESKQAIQEAADIWKHAYGKEVFIYDSQAGLPINFIYDDRQSLNTEINQTNDTLKQKDTNLKPELEEHKRKAADLQRRIEQLNSEIDSWNAKGGAPKEVYERLKDDQNSLRQEADALNAEAESLSLETEKFNTDVEHFNQTINTYKNALDERPEGGQYVRNEDGEKIDIYIYSTREELINILAHEFGHALGMDHVIDPQAIMYAQSNEAVTPSSDDLAALTVACKEKNIVTMKFTEFAFSFNHFIDSTILKK